MKNLISNTYPKRLLSVASAVIVTALSIFAPSTRAADWPGPKPDGTVLLPNQWSLKPAGKHIDLGDFPVNIALHPSGKYAAVLHSGYGKHEIITIDVKKQKAISHTQVPEAFYGIVFSPEGDKVYCSGSSDEVIHVYDFDKGELDKPKTIKLRDAKKTGVPSGLAITPDGKKLYAANPWGHIISETDLTSGETFDLLLNPKDAPLKAVPASPDFDVAAAEKRAQAATLGDVKDAPYPYACYLDAKQNKLYVSLWGKASIAVMDTTKREIIAHIPTEEHPNEMLASPDGKRLFVGNANRNTVTVIDLQTNAPIETLYAAHHPNIPPGATPNSLAITPDGNTLFVANATLNCLAVFDVTTPAKSHSLGFIPTGWYPTSVRVTPDGKKLLIASGKGLISKPNPKKEYIGGLMKGTLTFLDIPSNAEKMTEKLRDWSKDVYACSPLKADLSATGTRPENNPIPGKIGDPSPIKYCIYIVKENRTYDQVLGDMKKGNGEPKICLFPEKVTPNLHSIADSYVLLDNFYAESEVSADGHEWSMGAIATDYVEKTWPISYGHNKSGKFPYPAEGAFPIAYPSGGYLWDKAKEAGVTYRSYGEFVKNGKTPLDPATTKLPALEGHFDPQFRSFDMNYSDLKRAERFISELKRFEKEGEMPRLQIVRIPNDHTNGAAKGKKTPTAFVAENDQAVGMVAEAISNSKFWPQTAVFIIEDDAQNGPDHVDAHRTTAFVLSPYAKRGVVDSTMYSSTSMLRTMELILGMKPMTPFDAAAVPMYNSFQPTPDLTPYKMIPAKVDMEAKNVADAFGADESERMDFAQEDAADDFKLNEIVWRSVRGRHSAMPPPVRAAYVKVKGVGEEDDDD